MSHWLTESLKYRKTFGSAKGCGTANWHKLWFSLNLSIIIIFPKKRRLWHRYERLDICYLNFKKIMNNKEILIIILVINLCLLMSFRNFRYQKSSHSLYWYTYARSVVLDFSRVTKTTFSGKKSGMKCTTDLFLWVSSTQEKFLLKQSIKFSLHVKKS